MDRIAKLELADVLRERYGISPRDAKPRILDEFVKTSGYHRKYALRLLSKSTIKPDSPVLARRRVYNEAVKEALIVLWEFDRQQVHVPLCQLGEFAVGQAVDANLLGCQITSDMGRHLYQAELDRGLEEGMSDDGNFMLVHNDGLSISEPEIRSQYFSRYPLRNFPLRLTAR